MHQDDAPAPECWQLLARVYGDTPLAKVYRDTLLAKVYRDTLLANVYRDTLLETVYRQPFQSPFAYRDICPKWQLNQERP